MSTFSYEIRLMSHGSASQSTSKLSGRFRHISPTENWLLFHLYFVFNISMYEIFDISALKRVILRETGIWYTYVNLISVAGIVKR